MTTTTMNKLSLLLVALVAASTNAWVSSSTTFTSRSSNSRLMMADINKGTVKWFDSTKGFGFIAPDDETSQDVFVHQTAIQTEGYRSLAQGEAVEYQTHEENGRLKAIHVTGPNGADVQGAPFAPRLDYN
ncbi:hypothetical protein MPSEU_000580100 [Mayamaea pseudoterrestris]|nr:hypothetical protein MPSEU_000580100 [Mayamaea pseudoterrestris]